MIAQEYLQPDALAALLWSLLCFVAGVAYAAYRAVGWVERMRSWAHTSPTPDHEESLS